MAENVPQLQDIFIPCKVGLCMNELIVSSWCMLLRHVVELVLKVKGRQNTAAVKH